MIVTVSTSTMHFKRNVKQYGLNTAWQFKRASWKVLCEWDCFEMNFAIPGLIFALNQTSPLIENKLAVINLVKQFDI